MPDTDLPPISAAYEGATYRIEQILGPRAHPDVAAVIAVLADALDGQRRYIGREIRREAAAYQRAHTAPGGTRLTYDGGLRRAARISDRSPL